MNHWYQTSPQNYQMISHTHACNYNLLISFSDCLILTGLCKVLTRWKFKCTQFCAIAHTSTHWSTRHKEESKAPMFHALHSLLHMFSTLHFLAHKHSNRNERARIFHRTATVSVVRWRVQLTGQATRYWLVLQNASLHDKQNRCYLLWNSQLFLLSHCPYRDLRRTTRCI